MVTQLLFGEIFYIEDKQQEWFKIHSHFDDYSGWVNIKQVLVISQDLFDVLVSTQTSQTYVNQPVAFAQSADAQIPLVFGSTLPLFKQGTFTIADTTYRYEGDEAYQCTGQTPERLAFFAIKYINAPYLWGGRSPFGIDCSGFTQNVFKFCGYTLLRDASQQAQQGTTINFVSEVQVGDLLFFSNFKPDANEQDDRITHVGMALGNEQVIHASGMVRIDTIDHLGIFNHEQGVYTHCLRLIKRII
ncbi:hydrolase Nlp/P60 [Bacteroidia bacterium]|nr:hydrolase Nlp/P60 [Bacteroidia bacterium]